MLTRKLIKEITNDAIMFGPLSDIDRRIESSSRWIFVLYVRSVVSACIATSILWTLGITIYEFLK